MFPNDIATMTVDGKRTRSSNIKRKSSIRGMVNVSLFCGTIPLRGHRYRSVVTLVILSVSRIDGRIRNPKDSQYPQHKLHRQELASIRHRFCRYGLKHVTTASLRVTLCYIRFFFSSKFVFRLWIPIQSNLFYLALSCFVHEWCIPFLTLFLHSFSPNEKNNTDIFTIYK